LLSSRSRKKLRLKRSLLLLKRSRLKSLLLSRRPRKKLRLRRSLLLSRRPKRSSRKNRLIRLRLPHVVQRSRDVSILLMMCPVIKMLRERNIVLNR